jgi:hypothetical protein
LPAFYHEKLGRPSLPPGTYFRLMMIGFSKASAWRVADSLTLRQFLGIGLDEAHTGSRDYLTHAFRFGPYNGN